MTAIATRLLSAVQSNGGQVRLDRGRLLIEADKPLPDDLIEGLRFHKTDIIRALELRSNDRTFATLCTMPRPVAYTPERWKEIVADARAFRDLWHSQAEGLGWKPENVFTLPGGLILLIEGGDVLAICERTAVIRSLDRRQFNACRFAALPGESIPSWRIWTSWSEP